MHFQPTYLYIKCHKVTGKLYFGKTVKTDPLKYNGSGIHWVRHIKKHGREYVETLWHCLFIDQEECTKFALMFSEQEDIVNSDLWLNLIPENGKPEGIIGSHHSLETKQKISISRKGQKLSSETKQKISANIKKWNNKNPEALKATKLKAAKSRIGFRHTEEAKKKMSLSTIGQFCSDETKRKMKVSHTGKFHSIETKLKLSLINTGHSVTDQTKRKQSEIAKNLPKFVCKYCSIQTTKANLTRWHDENCKHHNIGPEYWTPVLGLCNFF